MNAWVAGRAAPDDLVSAVTGSALAVDVAVEDAEPDPQPLAVLLAALNRAGTARARLVLPVPGDPGLALADEQAVRAGDARQAVLLLPSGPGAGAELVAVPVLGRAGGAGPDGVDTLRWHLSRLADVPAAVRAPVDVRQARRDLDAGLGEAVETLARLARVEASPAVLAGVRRLRAEAGATAALPPAHPDRAVRLLADAERLAGVLALVGVDVTGAGHGTDATAVAREAALRPVARVVRAALVAGFSALPDPVRAAAGPAAALS